MSSGVGAGTSATIVLVGWESTPRDGASASWVSEEDQRTDMDEEVSRRVDKRSRITRESNADEEYILRKA